MRTDEEIESWYEEEKKKALEALISATEKKENPEKAQMEYKNALKKIFARYSRLRLKSIEYATAKAKKEEAKKARLNSSLLGSEGSDGPSAHAGLFRRVSHAIIKKTLKLRR